jgi:polysaccharide export outer membrane protein
MKIIIPFCSLCLLLLLTSCENPWPSACCYEVHRVDEFVCDSYKIRQGKMAILELAGVDVAELPCDALDEYQDLIGEDDILSIEVYHPGRKDLSEMIRRMNRDIGFPVREGRVTIPDLPPVEVVGLTLEEARLKIQNQYREHVRDIDVFIGYKDRLTRKVELIGMVKIPAVPVNGKIRLYEVLSLAQIPPDANLFMSYVARRGELLPVDLHRLVTLGDMSQNIVMRPGDKIYIGNPQDASVMVMGEVNIPKSVHLPYGTISLKEALVAANGIPFTGNRNCIQVIRGGVACPKVYLLNWCHITQLPNDSLLLIPGDTVYVTEKPITQWNRFISQVMPSFGCFQAGFQCYNVLLN